VHASGTCFNKIKEKSKVNGKSTLKLTFIQVTNLINPDVSKTNENDHRAIGKAQSLFMIHPVSPGSIFMLPHGTRIVHKLQNFLRSEYARYGYEEVMTPLIYKKDLWEISGHWQNYMDDMFMVKSGREQSCSHNHEEVIDTDEGLFGLKPMNCPGHCLIFDSTPKSYRDLPIRLADFSPLHRYVIYISH
jgi:threonyl-tRNA synthetase